MSKTYDDEGFSPEELRALARWRVAEPPGDLAERVLARAARETAAVPAWRGLAMAAAALVLVGGFLTVRTLARAPTAPFVETRSVFQADAGPGGPEVRQAQGEGGLEIEPS